MSTSLKNQCPWPASTYTLPRTVQEEIVEKSKITRPATYSQSRMAIHDELHSLKTRLASAATASRGFRASSSTTNHAEQDQKVRCTVTKAPSRQPLNIFTEMRTIRTAVENQDARFNRLENKVDFMIKLLREEQRSSDLVGSLIDVIEHLIKSSSSIEDQDEEETTVEEKEVQTESLQTHFLDLPDLVCRPPTSAEDEGDRSEEADFGVYSLPSTDDEAEEEEQVDELSGDEENTATVGGKVEQDELEEEVEEVEEESNEHKLARLQLEKLEKLELELLRTKRCLAEALRRQAEVEESPLNSIE